MPKINIDHVLSVNSEDCAYPAVNLINADSKKQWKCKPGEKQATVILQLKQETLIESIDIGNEHSAFVEILVGKSTSINNDFKVLLVASSLMTLKESKDGTNTKGVRFFKKEQLTQPTADEKWDRVKIVCTQPFNKHVQYGLSFVVLHSSSGSREEDEPVGGRALGRFALKQDDNQDNDVTVGSWFAKRKDPLPNIPAKAAAAIRDASSPVNVAQSKNKKPTPKRPPKVTTPKNGAIASNRNTPKPDTLNAAKPNFNLTLRDDDDSPADDTDADSNYSPTKDSQSRLSDEDDIPDSDGSDSIIDKQPKRNRGRNGKEVNGMKRKMSESGGSSKAKIAKLPDREMKPFKRLLEGVTFVISGYQNPLRASLRTKAIEMGARYKPDWDPSCTHLICAFMNTPKFSQVQGRGKIVKKEWIEECHSRRKRLPWRRFALDRNHAGTSSEEEVWEEAPMPSTSSVSAVIESGVNRRNISSGSDTEEEIERVRAKKTAKKPNIREQAKPSPAKPVKTEDRFSDDTDLDSDGGSQTAKLPLPPLPDFLNNINIHIALDVNQEDRKMLTRYITAYKGNIVEETDNSMEYVISNSTGVAATFGEHFGVPVVSPDWVWKCSDEGILLPPLQFKLKYNTNSVTFIHGR